MTPKELATAYFDTWRTKDFDAFRALLSDDATFAGPLGAAGDADGCVQGIKGLSQITEDIVVEKMLADDEDVLTWFTLHTSVARPTPVVNWTHVQDGRIARIRVTFDPRELTGG
jgi:ketosteroid isomerase-like protein